MAVEPEGRNFGPQQCQQPVRLGAQPQALRRPLDAGNAGGLEKNTMYIGFLLERLVAANASSASLEKLAQKIITMS